MNFTAHSFAHRLKKILAGCVVVLLCIGIGAYVLAPYYGRTFLVHALEQQLHRPVSLHSLKFNPLKLSLRLRDLSVQAPDRSGTLFSVNELYVDLHASSLWTRTPVVEEILVKHPYFHLVRESDSQYNISDIIDLMMKPSASPLRYVLNNIQLQDGTIIFDDKPKHARQAITHLQFSLPFLSSMPNDANIYVKPDLSAQLNGAPFHLLAETKPFMSTHDTTLQLEARGLNLPDYVTYLPVPLKFRIDTGRLDSQLTLTFSNPPRQIPSVRLSGTVALHNIALTHGQPLLSFGQMHINIASSDLLRQYITFNSIELSHAHLNLQRNPNGEWDVARLLPSSPADKAAPSAPWHVQANAVKLADSDIHFTDLSTRQPFHTQIQAINLTFQHVTTEAGKPIAVTGTMMTDSGEHLSDQGWFTLSPFTAGGDFHLEHLAIRHYAPYYAHFVRFDVRAGTLDASARYKLGPSLQLDDATGRFDGLQLRLAGHHHDFLDFKQFALGGGQFNLAQRNLVINTITSQSGTLNLKQDASGQMNVMQLLATSSSPSPARTRKFDARSNSAAHSMSKKPSNSHVPSGSGMPWHWLVKQINLTHYAVNFFASGNGKIPTLAAKNIALQISPLSSTQQPAQLKLQSNIGNAGRLLAHGQINLNPLKLNLQLTASNLALAPLQSYVSQSSNIILTGGAVSAQGKLKLDSTAPLKLNYSGTVQVNHFSSLDRITAKDLLKWNHLKFYSLTLSTYPYFRLNTSIIVLSNFYSRLMIDPDGTFNLQHLFKSQAKPQVTPTAVLPGTLPGQTPILTAPHLAKSQINPSDTANSARKWIQIGRITLKNGHVKFNDHFIHPNYSANVTNLSGTITHLNSNTSNRADIALTGQVNDQGQLNINGQINPLSNNLYLDLLAKLSDFELSPLAPYAEKYAGYGIERGKMSFNVHYHVEDQKLTAENQLFLNQLTFGKKVDSPSATKLPVLLAVALLKDRDGNIDVNLPISGSLNDPDFSMGGLIFKAIVHLLEKVVTAPFSLIANLFSSSATMSHLDFMAGSSALPPTATAQLHALAQALINRPNLKLDITGYADPVLDRQSLRQRALARMVSAEKIKQLAAENRAADTVTVAPDEYPKYLFAAYKHDDAIPDKAHNFIGMIKTLPVTEMEALILAHITISDDQLRQLAFRRATAVKTELVKTGGIPSERIFIDASKLSADNPDHLSPSRVDFSLGVN
ncbi:MAG: DUF748 domain-containing protein [Betaproteobacteria bacterium]|nr:DUF748 domain-containing protein [Betaproteobacteria bacterium]